MASVQERTASSGAVAEPPEDVKKLRQARSIYLRPDQWREIDGAVFDLAAKHRERMSASKVEEEFHDRYFAKFLTEQLGAPAKGRRKNGGTKAGDE